MYKYVLEKYQQWANAGYCEKYICRTHDFIDLLICVDPDGLFLLCPFGDYQHYISAGEYFNIQRKIQLIEIMVNTYNV